MRQDRFGDLSADGVERVERGEWVLKYGADAAGMIEITLVIGLDGKLVGAPSISKDTLPAPGESTIQAADVPVGGGGFNAMGNIGNTAENNVKDTIDKFHSCILRSVKALDFPKAENAPVTFKYPLNFSAKNAQE